MSDLIEFSAVSKRYGSRVAVDSLSFCVREGSVTGLLGPNGAGKSTAMRLLLGIARADAGRATLFGAGTGDTGFRDALHRCGALIEEPSLYANASGRGNLEIQAAALGISRRDPRLDRMLEMVGLSSRSSDTAKKYSLGMRQRLALAIALVNDPELVILDEPTNGLDPAGVVEIRELIKSLPASGTTVLVSSHLLSEVQKTADHVVIIDQGRLVRDDTVEGLIAAAGSDGGFRVRVHPSYLQAAMAALSAKGFNVADGGDGSITVSGEIAAGWQISQPLAEAGVFLDELSPQTADLESAFLQMTGPGAGGAL